MKHSCVSRLYRCIWNIMYYTLVVNIWQKYYGSLLCKFNLYEQSWNVASQIGGLKVTVATPLQSMTVWQTASSEKFLFKVSLVWSLVVRNDLYCISWFVIFLISAQSDRFPVSGNGLRTNTGMFSQTSLTSINHTLVKWCGWCWTLLTAELCLH